MKTFGGENRRTSTGILWELWTQLAHCVSQASFRKSRSVLVTRRSAYDPSILRANPIVWLDSLGAAARSAIREGKVPPEALHALGADALRRLAAWEHEAVRPSPGGPPRSLHSQHARHARLPEDVREFLRAREVRRWRVDRE